MKTLATIGGLLGLLVVGCSAIASPSGGTANGTRTEIHLAADPRPWFPYLSGKTDIYVGDVVGTAASDETLYIRFADGVLLVLRYRRLELSLSYGCQVLAAKDLFKGSTRLVAVQPCKSKP